MYYLAEILKLFFHWKLEQSHIKFLNKLLGILNMCSILI